MFLLYVHFYLFKLFMSFIVLVFIYLYIYISFVNMFIFNSVYDYDVERISKALGV